jgi:hypothetical protein
MTSNKTVCLLALALASVGCSAESDKHSSFTHLTLVDAQHFAVHRHDGPDAIVSSAGELSIAGKAMSLNSSQKELVVRYFSGATALRQDALATGMAGASTAATALSSVVTGLASGKPETIGPAINDKAAKVEASADKVCRDVRDLAAAQDALAASVADFKPYALISEKQTTECPA